MHSFVVRLIPTMASGSDALRIMLACYEGRRAVPGDYLGPATLLEAYDGAPPAVRNASILLLETGDGRARFPDLDWEKRAGAKGCCCDFVVHDGARPFFFSRIVAGSRATSDRCYRY